MYNSIADEKENQNQLLLFMSKSSGTFQKSPTLDTPKNVILETGRYITSDGRVISMFNDDSIKVSRS